MRHARQIGGTACLAGFVATIPAANWTLSQYGFRDMPVIGPVPSGVAWVGLAFVLRDVAQLLTSKRATLAAIAIGVGLSFLLADERLAVASAVAFGASELLDWCVYTPLAERRFVMAVVASSLAGGCVDSALFLQLAFSSSHGWVGLAAAKAVVIGVATPAAAWVRSRVVPRNQP